MIRLGESAFGLRLTLRALALAAVTAAAAPTLASAAQHRSDPRSPRAAFEAAVRLYQEASAMCADFEQRIEIRLIGRTVESRGRVCQQRPNLFSMRFAEPAGDRVVSDGESLWVYYGSLDEDQVVRYPVAESPAGTDFFKEFLAEPGVRYALEEVGEEEAGGARCFVVELAPLRPGAYRRARLWIDAETHVLRRLQVHQSNSAVRTLALSNARLGSTADDGAFIFRLPAGARVVSPGRPAGSS